MKKYFFLIYILLTSIFGFSQNEQQLEQVNVVAMNIPVDVNKTGRFITVITEDEITDFPASSVEEVLRSLPGLNVNSRAGFGVQSDIGMRGSTFSQVLVLIDGVRWNEPLTAHFNNTIPVPLNEIAKIEIIHGAASAVYGADAVGGVIHIQTKTFANSVAKTSTSGSYFFGENQLHDADLSGRVQLAKNVQVSAGYKKAKSDGEQFSNPNFALGNSEEETYNTDFDVETYTFASSYKPSDSWSLNARYAKDERDFAAKYFYTRSSFDESRETVDSYYGQFSAQHHIDNQTTNLSVGFKETNDLFVFNPAFTPNMHTTQSWTGVASHQYETKKQHLFSFGMQYDSQTIESTDRGNHDQDQLEAFATSLLNLSDDFTTVISLRGGHNEDYGFKFTPQASLAYNLKQAIIRASVARAVRGADFTERFVSFNIPQLSPGRNIGNPDLDVETSTTYDLGIDLRTDENWSLSTTGFYRNSSNLIDYTLVNASEVNNAPNLIAGEQYFQTRNIGSASTFGVEFNTDYFVAFGNNNSFKPNLNYTYLHTSIADDLASKYLANHPNHQANLNLNLKIGQFSLNSTNQYIARNGEALADFNAAIKDNYFVSHAKIGYNPKECIGLNLRLNNAFDTNYQEILGSQMPGRWVSAGVNWRLN